LEEDSAYAVSMEDAKQWIKQNVIMPEGTEVRLSEGMPKADAKYPIAYDEGKFLVVAFYAVTKEKDVRNERKARIECKQCPLFLI